MNRIEFKYSQIKIILIDKRVCHAIYLGQISIITLLIIALGIFVLITSYGVFNLLSHAKPENFDDYLKLLGVLSGGPLCIVILKLLQKLSVVSTQYLTALNKFNSQIIKIESEVLLEDKNDSNNHGKK